jgi:hypothetical protein
MTHHPKRQKPPYQRLIVNFVSYPMLHEFSVPFFGQLHFKGIIDLTVHNEK